MKSLICYRRVDGNLYEMLRDPLQSVCRLNAASRNHLEKQDGSMEKKELFDIRFAGVTGPTITIHRTGSDDKQRRVHAHAIPIWHKACDGEWEELDDDAVSCAEEVRLHQLRELATKFSSAVETGSFNMTHWEPCDAQDEYEMDINVRIRNAGCAVVTRVATDYPQSWEIPNNDIAAVVVAFRAQPESEIDYERLRPALTELEIEPGTIDDIIGRVSCAHHSRERDPFVLEYWFDSLPSTDLIDSSFPDFATQLCRVLYHWVGAYDWAAAASIPGFADIPPFSQRSKKTSSLSLN